jgi:hypothetical protein
MLFVMKRFLPCYVLLLTIWLVGCTPPQAAPPPPTQLKPAKLDSTVKIVAGQTVYVPIYSNIYMWDQNRKMDLTAILSVRNTDQTNPIVITSVNYFDDNGKLLHRYLEQPGELGTMSSTSFVVNQEDRRGGSGASFVIEWVAPKEVSAPVIESVMINTSGNQGISFVSPGRVIKSRASSK